MFRRDIRREFLADLKALTSEERSGLVEQLYNVYKQVRDLYPTSITITHRKGPVLANTGVLFED